MFAQGITHLANDLSTLGGKDADAAPLPAATGAILLDLLALGHWERVFSQHRHWPLGGTVKVRLLVPTAAPRFDYHLPVTGPRPVEPREVTAAITVEALEEVAMFGARVQAFRCQVEPMGLTLWVSPHGGILRFEDGRGLSGALEP